MKQQPNQLKIETAPGLVDVYNGEIITSFAMLGADLLNVKDRLPGIIAYSYNIDMAETQ